MAESMFEPTMKSRKTWRTVVIAAAVPFAMLGAAPAAGAAETELVETVNGEQLQPPAPPPGAPDPAAELEQCLNDVLALVTGAPAPAAAPAEQAPPAPGGPDLAPLNELCQQILTTLQPAPAPAPADGSVGAP